MRKSGFYPCLRHLGTTLLITIAATITTAITQTPSALAQGYTYHDLGTAPVGMVNVSSGPSFFESSSTGTALGGSGFLDGERHALRWNTPGGPAIDLNPVGFTDSQACGTSGLTTAGFGSGPGTSNASHALLWTAPTASSVIDLHPAGFENSFAYGTGGNFVVGSANTPSNSHALLWTGSTPTSAIDLHPVGFSFSEAYGTDGTFVVGRGDSSALVWTGTSADSCIDLSPTAFGYDLSSASAVSGSLIVGWSRFSQSNAVRAIAWSGLTPESYHALDFGVFTQTSAMGTNGTYIVGSGTSLTVNDHALLWTGTDPGSLVDLTAFLPAEYNRSFATGIDAAGNISGWGYVDIGGGVNEVRAFYLSPHLAAVPEVSSLALVTCGLLSLSVGLRRRRAQPAGVL